MLFFTLVNVFNIGTAVYVCTIVTQQQNCVSHTGIPCIGIRKNFYTYFISVRMRKLNTNFAKGDIPRNIVYYNVCKALCVRFKYLRSILT